MKQKVKILEIVSYSPPWTGWSTRVMYLKNQLLERGYVCKVLNISPESRKIKSDEYIDVQNGIDYIFKVAKYCLLGYRIHMHVNGDSIKGFILTLLAEIISLLTFKRCFLTFHAGGEQLYFPRQKVPSLTPMYFIIFTIPQIIICNNDVVKKKIMEYGINEKKIIPIPAFSKQYLSYQQITLPQEVEKFITDHKPILSSYIFFRPEFYLGSLLKAIKKLIDKYPQLGFIMVAGSGPEEEEIIKLIKTLNLGNNIFIMENVTHEVFLTILKKSEIYVRTPSRDGTCSSVLEALALNIPVVASENNNRPEGVITFNSNDAEDLANKIESVVNNYEKVKISIPSPKIKDTLLEETELLIGRRKIKILEIVSYSPPRTGWSIRAEYIKKRLLEKGYICKILNISPESRKIKSDEYIDVQNGIDYIFKVAKYCLLDYRIHMHINGQSIKGFILALISVFLSVLFRNRYILTFHAGVNQLYFPRQNSYLIALLLFIVFTFSKKIICNDELVKAKIIEYGINKDKIIPIPAFSQQYLSYNNTNLPDEMEQFINQHNPILSSYIFDRPQFHIPTTLKAIREVIKEYPNLGLIFVGPIEYLQSTRELIQTLNLNPNIFLGNNLFQAQFLTLLKRSKIFIRSYEWDGVCSSVLQSLSLKTPVIGCENSLRPKDVIIFKTGDEVSLASKIKYVLKNYEEIKKNIQIPKVEDTVSTEVELLIS